MTGLGVMEIVCACAKGAHRSPAMTAAAPNMGLLRGEAGPAPAGPMRDVGLAQGATAGFERVGSEAPLRRSE